VSAWRSVRALRACPRGLASNVLSAQLAVGTFLTDLASCPSLFVLTEPGTVAFTTVILVEVVNAEVSEVASTNPALLLAATAQ